MPISTCYHNNRNLLYLQYAWTQVPTFWLHRLYIKDGSTHSTLGLWRRDDGGMALPERLWIRAAATCQQHKKSCFLLLPDADETITPKTNITLYSGRPETSDWDHELVKVTGLFLFLSGDCWDFPAFQAMTTSVRRISAKRGVYEWAVVWGATSLCSHYSHHALFRQKHREAFCRTACRQLSASWPRTEEEKKTESDMFSPEGRRRVGGQTNTKWCLKTSEIQSELQNLSCCFYCRRHWTSFNIRSAVRYKAATEDIHLSAFM